MKGIKSAIVDYYDLCESDYRIFWDLDRSLAMHAGFWDDTTKTLHEALNRENEILAAHAKITKKDRVLDAGCGIGGSSIFLAKRYGCHVTGITLSAKQAETASALAAEHGVESFVTFKVKDFCQTDFPDGSFDVVWGLESVCHAEDKAKFVKEAMRVLKAGGRLIVADGFATNRNFTKNEASAMQKWVRGWGVDTLESRDGFKKHLKEAGFTDISLQDITSNVLPSSKRLYLISFPAFVFSKIGEWTGLRKKIQTDNIVAAYYQYTTLKKQLWTYCVFSARKLI